MPFFWKKKKKQRTEKPGFSVVLNHKEPSVSGTKQREARGIKEDKVTYIMVANLDLKMSRVQKK